MYSALKQISCEIQQLFLVGRARRYLPAVEKTLNSSSHFSSSSTHHSPITLETNSELEKRKKMLELELQMLREEGEFFVPEHLTDEHCSHLLSLSQRHHRLKFYKYLKKIEISTEKKKRTKEINALQYAQRIEANDNNPHIVYGLRNNSFFMQIRQTAMNKFYNYNITNSILHGEKLVLDFGYNENMNQREMKSCMKQVQELYGFNKASRDPFDLYFCNLESNSDFDKKICKAIGTLKTSTCLVNATDKSYLDFFPKEKLVYLTPDCNSDLHTFNYDDVYVIGGLVDLGPSVPLGLAKAKKEGLRTARLPLERYLNWTRGGQKALTLDQIVKILLTVKNTRSWTKAFQYVPARKVDPNS